MELIRGLNLVIGGPRDGQLVDWDIEKRYWEVLEEKHSPLTEHSYTRSYYEAQRIILFDYECYIWVFERNKNTKWEEKLLENILSFKGAQVIFSGKYRKPVSSLFTPRFQDK